MTYQSYSFTVQGTLGVTLRYLFASKDTLGCFFDHLVYIAIVAGAQVLTLQILLLEWILKACGRGGNNRIEHGLEAIQPPGMMSLASVKQQMCSQAILIPVLLIHSLNGGWS